jgi:hypothetical protein
MRSSLKAALPLALVASAIAVAPAGASVSDAPKAHASGGDVSSFTYPSVVAARIVRTERALQRANKQIESGDAAGQAAAVISLKVVRRQMSSAWRGAKYVIKNAPPPPAAADGTPAPGGPSIIGTPPGAVTYATPPDTGFRVLTLQHDVATSVAQLIDGAHGTGLNALSTTLNFALDRRDQAIKDILALSPPAPPAAADGVRAHASGGLIVSSFDTVMPNVVPQIDDELQAIAATQSDATDLTAGGKRLLTAAAAQATKTQAFVNTTWPPLPADD